MTRHAKNVTAGNIYTSHEKKKDARESGYGTHAIRLGKDSIKEFDCCSLTLQPCREAVITPDGHLYDKEAILENIIHQKRDIAKKTKEFEKQKARHQKEARDVEKNKEAESYKKFVEKQSFVSSSGDKVGDVLAKAAEDKDKQLPSFWIPSLTPNFKPTEIKKPDDKVRCPMSGKPLRLKDLISVNFTLSKDGDKRSLITKDGRYVCAVTNDLLGNSVPCAVLKASGSVVTMECIEKIIKKDWIDPTNGKKLTEKDIIPLQRGSSGFAGAGITLEAKRESAVMQA
jgi:nitric oxide synthase-interacting protein